MAKNNRFSLAKVRKHNAEYNIQKSVIINDMEFAIDEKFRPSLIGDMAHDYIETTFVLEREGYKYNLMNLLQYFMVLRFTNVGREVQKEIDSRLKKQKNRDQYSLMKVKATAHLSLLGELYDAGLIEQIGMYFNRDQFKIVLEHYNRWTDNMKHIIAEGNEEIARLQLLLAEIKNGEEYQDKEAEENA